MKVPQNILLAFICLMKKHDEYTQKQLTLLGKRIRQLRIEKGYTNYEQFAFTHNINRSQYGKYENGEDLRFSSLLKVVKAHNMTLAEFFSEGFE